MLVSVCFQLAAATGVKQLIQIDLMALSHLIPVSSCALRGFGATGNVGHSSALNSAWRQWMGTISFQSGVSVTTKECHSHPSSSTLQH